MEWKLADAKNKLSEVVNKALLEGPQKIIRRNDAVIVVSEMEYEKLIGKKKSLKEHLMQGPDFEDLNLTRDVSSMRVPNL